MKRERREKKKNWTGNFILGHFGRETKWVRNIIRRSNLKKDWVDIYNNQKIEMLILKATGMQSLSGVLQASLNMNEDSNLNDINY